MLGLGTPSHSTQSLKDSNPYNQLLQSEKEENRFPLLTLETYHPVSGFGALGPVTPEALSTRNSGAPVPVAGYLLVNP